MALAIFSCVEKLSVDEYGKPQKQFNVTIGTSQMELGLIEPARSHHYPVNDGQFSLVMYQKSSMSLKEGV